MLIVRRGIKLTLTQKKAPLVAGVDNPLRSFRSHSWSRSGRPRLFTTEGLIVLLIILVLLVLLLVVNCAIADLKGYICCKCRTWWCVIVTASTLLRPKGGIGMHRRPSFLLLAFSNLLRIKWKTGLARHQQGG